MFHSPLLPTAKLMLLSFIHSRCPEDKDIPLHTHKCRSICELVCVIPVVERCAPQPHLVQLGPQRFHVQHKLILKNSEHHTLRLSLSISSSLHQMCSDVEHNHNILNYQFINTKYFNSEKIFSKSPRIANINTQTSKLTLKPY